MKRGSVVDKISFPYLRAVEIIEKSSCWMQIVIFPLLLQVDIMASLGVYRKDP